MLCVDKYIVCTYTLIHEYQLCVVREFLYCAKTTTTTTKFYMRACIRMAAILVIKLMQRLQYINGNIEVCVDVEPYVDWNYFNLSYLRNISKWETLNYSNNLKTKHISDLKNTEIFLFFYQMERNIKQNHHVNPACVPISSKRTHIETILYVSCSAITLTWMLSYGSTV